MLPSPVLVVCGLLYRGGTLLIAQRAPGKNLGGLWEFPGGKVDPGESAEQALVREWLEELGCEILVLSPLQTVRQSSERGDLILQPFWCRLAEGSPEPRALEHTQLAWVLLDQLLTFTWCPADLPIVDGLHSGAIYPPDEVTSPK